MPETHEETEEFTYDPEAAERGWRATASLREAVGKAALPPVDLADVAILALRVSRELLKPDVRAAFERLPSEHFDAALIDRIEPAAWGLWYANTGRISLEATESGGRVRAATLEEGLAIKTRMMRVCEYILSDDPKAGLEIASIRSGTGHKDLAYDVSRLAKLYEAHAALLDDGGGKHYDPADATAAKRVAAKILFEIGEGQAKALQDAKDDAARAFVVLEDAYDRIRRWGAAIWNDDERFPTLFSVRTRTAAPRAANPTGGDTDPTEAT